MASYGYFDYDNREYVITNPELPLPPEQSPKGVVAPATSPLFVPL